MSEPPSEKPKVAIVTGGSGGIGLACARRFAAAKNNLVLAYGKDDARATAAREELVKEHGVQAVCVRGDLTTEDGRTSTVDAIFEAVDGLGGAVSAFVHAAGYFHEELLSHHFDGGMANFEVYDAYASIYPKAFVAICERALPLMGAGGRIVAISNPGCNATQTPRVGYDMPGQGKAAMEHIVRMVSFVLQTLTRPPSATARRRVLISPPPTHTHSTRCARRRGASASTPSPPATRTPRSGTRRASRWAAATLRRGANCSTRG